MFDKKITHVIIIIILMGLLACNLFNSGPVPSTALAPTDTEMGISTAVAASLTAIASLTPATPTPTFTSTPTSTPTLTLTPTPSATASPTKIETLTPSPTATKGLGQIPHLLKPIYPIFPISPAKLDYTANALYGEVNLGAGFSPDPCAIGTNSGGNVDVSYISNGCSGFASSAPDLRVNYSGGGASLMRFYFIGGNGDARLIVNDPYGNFYCVDDSFGTVNPTIDFNNPAGGTYDVWIASYAPGTKVSGTFFISGATSNHP